MNSYNKERLSSGINGLDTILNGGFIANRSYLLVGPPGSGRTIFSFQWLLDGSQKGEECLYISLAEPLKELSDNLSSFGWDISRIQVVELGERIGTKAGYRGEYQVFSPGEVEEHTLWQALYEEVEGRKPRRLVVDSATYLRFLSVDELQLRRQIYAFINFLREAECTTIFTHEPFEVSGEIVFALAADGIIRLRREVSEGRVVEIRSLEVQKFRGSDYIGGLHPFRITGKGIVVFPHEISKGVHSYLGERIIRSGVPEIDELLGGGIESGTATIITGPTGVGKTTLGTQFITHSCASNLKGAIFSFEESIESIVKRSSGVGIPLSEMISNGVAFAMRINPMELYPDEFFSLVKNVVENSKVDVVLIDSLRGYQLAMEQFGTLVSHFQNLVNYLNYRGVTTFVVNEVEHITGNLTLTELGVSFLIDNAIIIRFMEISGEVKSVIACLKKRLGSYQKELREFEVTKYGIKVGEKLEGMMGILTGIPEKAEGD